jgi:hypothetical protein
MLHFFFWKREFFMSDADIKQGSGCKRVGCGCLILAALLTLVIGLAVFFSLRSSSSGKIEAHHFLPDEAAGSVLLNLHQADAGLAAVYHLLLKEALKSEEANIPGWVESILPGLSGSGLNEGPVGPRVIISLPRTVNPTSTFPLVIIDLHSYSRAAAVALQISLKTTFASMAAETVYHGITLYDDELDVFDFAMHKGFLIAAGDMDTLRSGVDALEAAKAAEWPEGLELPQGCDLHAVWSGNFSALAIVGIEAFDLAAPKDGDFAQPVEDVTRAELCVDVVTADQLTFTLQGVTETEEAVHRVAADLQEHARELQANLKESNLDFQFSTRTDALTAILEGELHGLEDSIRNLLSVEDPAPEPPEQSRSGE